MSPRPSIADERRPQILDAAARVIAARGFDGLRLSDVAEEGGFSVGTVQHYFGSREALLDGAFRQMQASSLRRWYAVAGREPDPWRRLTSLFESASIDNDRFRERWTLWLEFWAMCLRDEAMRRDSGDLHGAWQAPLREAIESGIAAGRFDPRCSIDDVVDRAARAHGRPCAPAAARGPGLDRASGCATSSSTRSRPTSASTRRRATRWPKRRRSTAPARRSRARPGGLGGRRWAGRPAIVQRRVRAMPGRATASGSGVGVRVRVGDRDREPELGYALHGGVRREQSLPAHEEQLGDDLRLQLAAGEDADDRALRDDDGSRSRGPADREPGGVARAEAGAGTSRRGRCRRSGRPRRTTPSSSTMKPPSSCASSLTVSRNSGRSTRSSERGMPGKRVEDQRSRARQRLFDVADDEQRADATPLAPLACDLDGELDDLVERLLALRRAAGALGDGVQDRRMLVHEGSHQ